MARRKTSSRRREPADDMLTAPHEPLEGEAGTVIRLADGAIFTFESSDEPGRRRRVRQPPVERYGARGQLTSRQVQAARNWYSDWAAGVHGVKRRDPLRTFATGTVLRFYGPRDSQVQALTRWRQARETVDPAGRALAELIICNEIAAREVAAVHGTTSGPVMNALRDALDAMADYYTLDNDRD